MLAIVLLCSDQHNDFVVRQLGNLNDIDKDPHYTFLTYVSAATFFFSDTELLSPPPS